MQPEASERGSATYLYPSSYFLIMLIHASRRSLTSLFLLPSVAFLPPQHTTSTRVQDAATGIAVPYASVGVKGKSIGTVANAQGHFTTEQLAAAAPPTR